MLSTLIFGIGNIIFGVLLGVVHRNLMVFRREQSRAQPGNIEFLQVPLKFVLEALMVTVVWGLFGAFMVLHIHTT